MPIINTERECWVAIYGGGGGGGSRSSVVRVSTAKVGGHGLMISIVAEMLMWQGFLPNWQLN